MRISVDIHEAVALTEAPTLYSLPPVNVVEPDFRGVAKQRKLLEPIWNLVVQLGRAANLDASLVPVLVADLTEVIGDFTLPRNIVPVVVYRVDDGVQNTRMPATVVALTHRNGVLVFPDRTWLQVAASHGTQVGPQTLGVYNNAGAALGYVRSVTPVSEAAVVAKDEDPSKTEPKKDGVR